MSNEFENEYENENGNKSIEPQELNQEIVAEDTHTEEQPDSQTDVQVDTQTDVQEVTQTDVEAEVSESTMYSIKREDLQYNHWEAQMKPDEDSQKGVQTDWIPQPESQPQPEPQSQQQQQEEKPYGFYYEAPKGSQPSNVTNMAKKKFFKKAVGLVVSALVFGVIAGAAFQGVEYLTGGTDSESTYGAIQTTETTGDEASLNSTTVTGAVSGDSDVSDIVENTMPSIVSITSTVSQSITDFFGREYSEDAEGSGSGIIVGKNDTQLLIATNNHVVADSTSIKVTFINDEVVDATVKGTDKGADLAVVAVDLSDLKKETLDAIKVANIGDSAKTKVGEMVIAIGNALGYGQSVTVGYISAKDREVTVDNITMTLLQTDAAINPGNSGGALLNANGQLIGINSVKYASNEVEGMGYAIPISKALPIIKDLMNKVPIKAGEEGYLGINGQSVPEEMAATYNMPIGAYVIDVSEGSAADKAGILPGDIITKVNGASTGSMEEVKEKVNGNVAGTKISVTLQRRTGAEYKEMEFDVVLQKMDDATKKNLEDAAKESVQEETPDTEEESGMPFGYDFEQ